MDKGVVTRNFSRSASSYDACAGVQRLAAALLIDEIPDDKVGSILEIGCGTGLYTRLLKEKFRSSRITAMDISESMVRYARENVGGGNIAFTVGDAEEMPLEESYDLVTSNAAVHWFSSCEDGLRKMSYVLNKKARFIFSTFGPLTLCELAGALHAAGMEKALGVDSGDFPDREDLERMLSGFLSKVSFREIVLQEEYASFKDLLENIKSTGTRGSPRGGARIWSRRL
ncbi:MAG: methyltransferase domain-containing protein, partial [Candidatus Omnitrophica bacterium]|nr:methyltransferase domain-containing protein [Candidatus Omnitrophota bacterium]